MGRERDAAERDRGLALRALDPALERRVFVAARAGPEEHPLIRAVVAALT
jgi:hypothetical protein